MHVDKEARDFLRRVLEEFRSGAITNKQALRQLDSNALWNSKDESVSRLTNLWYFAFEDYGGRVFFYEPPEEDGEDKLARDIAFLTTGDVYDFETNAAKMSWGDKVRTLLWAAVILTLFLLLVVGRILG